MAQLNIITRKARRRTKRRRRRTKARILPVAMKVGRESSYAMMEAIRKIVCKGSHVDLSTLMMSIMKVVSRAVVRVAQLLRKMVRGQRMKMGKRNQNQVLVHHQRLQKYLK